MEADAVFRGDPLVEGRTGERGQDEELGRGQAGPLGPADCFAHRLPIVLVEAEDEHAVDVDAMAAEDLDRPRDLVDRLVFLSCPSEVLGVDRLKPI